MSVSSIVSNAKAVAADGRLHTVRTRHDHLASLFRAVQRQVGPLLEATLQSFPKLGQSFVELSLAQVLTDLQYEAKQQNEEQTNKENDYMAACRSKTAHLRNVPIGTVAIAGYSIDTNPVAAVFGPLVSAISSGCPAIIFTDDNSFSSLVASIVDSSLDKEAYAVVLGGETSFQSFYETFDKVVTFKPTKLPQALHVSSTRSNVIVVDQSLVSEQVYRVKGRRPTAREVPRLAAAAQLIAEAKRMATLSAILVSETIAPILNDLIQSSSSSATKTAQKSVPTISCRSTEHILAEVERFDALSSSLFIFADLKQGAYLSRFSQHSSCSLNCIPVELLMGYVPTIGSARVEAGTEDLHLKPLWSTELFTKKVSTISAPVKKIDTGIKTARVLAALSAQAPFMKRKKPTHLDFFPTGFKITAFPFLLSVLGLTSYSVFRVGRLAYSTLRQVYLEK